jgi:hypothetical protein
MSSQYEFVSIYGYQGLYWPVFRRPGKQRKTRRAFCEFSSALTYAMHVDRRLKRKRLILPWKWIELLFRVFHG